tara:strand:+ start:544 stop:1362 length:819 start_codon:yes stop_codon:yes gene_type:complete
MANNTTISIDTVYQRVLALANKEQRGYITPQEFNLHANQAQLDIFEQYFYDLAAHTAVAKRGDQAQQSPTAAPALEPDFGDSINLLREKITIYAGADTNMVFSGGNFHLPSINNTTIYRTGRMYYAGTGGAKIPLKRIEYYSLPRLKEAFDGRAASRWHKNYQDAAEFYYTENTDGSISLYKENLGQVSQGSSGDLKVEVVATVPDPVNWGYVVVNEKALYNSGTSTDFNMHRSEETNLVIKVLELAGITINKPGLVGLASAEEQQNDAQKQ